MKIDKREYSSSEQTKQAMASALKELMAQKPIDRITIHEITERCGMRRQNFYYHFEDVYDLMRWMFEREAVPLLQDFEGTTLWQDGLLQLFRYLEENRAVCLCALRSVGRDHLRRFFEADIYAIIQRTVEQIADEVGASEHGISDDDIELMTHLHVVGFAAIRQSWLLGEIDKEPEELIRFCDRMLQDHIRGAKARWTEE